MKILKIKNYLTLAVFLMLLVSPVFSLAQEPGLLPAGTPGPAIPAPVSGLPNTVNCFDYYEFGSVQADIYSETRSVLSGTEMIFKGEVVNNNNYPIVDGSVYVKIFAENLRNSDQVHSNGYPVVDQFFAVENINLDANSKSEISFKWVVPAYAVSGKYHIATFFVTAKKFNLLGLSFTDDIVGNSFDFEVRGEMEGGVSFNKDSVVINGDQYRFAAFTPKIPKDSSTTISATLNNTTGRKLEIPVVWKVYKWDALLEENKINESRVSYQVEAGVSEEVNLTLDQNDFPVYLVVGEAQFYDTKSILNIRFTKDGVNQTRINFPALTSFPLKKNKDTTLFSCLHGMGTLPVVKDGKLILSLEDKKGNKIRDYVYTGDVTGAMMAVKDNFIPKKSYDYIKLSANLYNKEKLVDRAEIVYDCELINKDKCYTVSLWWYLAWFVLALLVIWLVWRVFFVKKSRVNLILLFFVFYLILPGSASAKSVVWSSTDNTSKLFYYMDNSGPPNQFWAPALTNFNTSILYSARIIDANSGRELQDGEELSVGDKIKLEFKKFEDKDISWFGMGYSSDSPYGHWKKNAAAPDTSCNQSDFISKITVCGVKQIDLYIPLTVNPPNLSINTERGTAGLKCVSNICEILSPGKIKVDFIFSSTFGKFYYSYFDNSFYTKCYPSLKPLRSLDLTFYASQGCSVFSGEKVSGCRIGDPLQPKILPGETICPIDVLNSSDFSISVPEKKISFDFDAVGGDNNPPTDPQIKLEDSVCVVGTACKFSFVSTDSDNPPDKLKYGIGWGGDETIDQVIPGEFIASGVPAHGSKKWITPGVKTIKAIASDERSAHSGWSEYKVNVVSLNDLVFDSGLRLNQGTDKNPQIVKIAAEAEGSFISPLRIMTKRGVRSIPLVDINDPSATKIRIMTKQGVKALMEFR